MLFRSCTDPMSLAYNVEAKKDDGSCTYPEVSKKSLVLRKTGDWCHYCGEYATDWVNDIENTYSNTVKVIDLHSNDGFAGNQKSKPLVITPSRPIEVSVFEFSLSLIVHP